MGTKGISEKGLRKGGLTYRMLEYMYYVQMCRTADLRTAMRCKRTSTTEMSYSYARLLKLGYITSERGTYKVSVTKITRKGIVYYADREGVGSYADNHYNLVEKEYKHYATRKEVEKYFEIVRMKSMLTATEVATFEKDKPSLDELYSAMGGALPPSSGVSPENSYYGLAYKNMTAEEINNLLETSGVFYSAREVRDWIVRYTDVSDLLNKARYNGIVISKRRLLLVYAHGFDSSRMIKANYNDAIAHDDIEKMFERVDPTYRANALVIANSESLVYQMATGWKWGVFPPERKKYLEQRLENQKNRRGMKRGERLQIDSETGHERTLPSTVPVTGTLEHPLDSKEYARNSAEYIHTSPKLDWNTSVFSKIFVCPAVTEGIDALRTLLLRSDSEMYERGIELAKSAGYVGSDGTNGIVGYDGSTPIVLVAVYEIKTLHRLSVDSPSEALHKSYKVITTESMVNTVSHCIRKEIKGLDLLDDLKPMECFVRQFDADGYVTNMEDPYAYRRVKKGSLDNKKRTYRKHTSIVSDAETQKRLKKAAHKSGVSLNRYILDAVKKQTEADLKDDENGAISGENESDKNLDV